MVCKEVICGFPPGHQGIYEILDVGIELGDVASDGQDVGVECTEFGSNVHDG